MSNVIEADMLHFHGRRHGYIRNGEDVAALSGSETGAWYQRGCVGTWEIQGTLPDGSSDGQPEKGRKPQGS